MPPTTDAVAEPWSQPTAYERWYASSLGRVYGASLTRVLQPWLSRISADRALDVGCGPGLGLEQLLQRNWRVIGLDCSAEMARRARARTDATIAVGSVDRLPFRDAGFDLVFCVNCLEFVGDRRAAFAEIARVLGPDGSAVLGVLNRHSVWEFTRRVNRPFSRRVYYSGHFYTIHDMRRHCGAAGLAIEEIRSAVHFPPIPPGPLSGFYDRFDEQRQRRTRRWAGVILCRAVKTRGNDRLSEPRTAPPR